MLCKTKGIVLQSINYSDSSVIAQIYTELFGRQSYWLGGKGTKSKHARFSLLQPMFLVEIELDHNPKKELQRIREISIAEPLTSIPYYTVKSTMALFLTEVINKCLREIEANQNLFSFLYNSICFLDAMQKGVNNFHLLFLLNFVKLLGFEPENNFSEENPFFDLINAQFVSENFHIQCLSPELSKLLSLLLETSYTNIETIKLTTDQRTELLEKIIDFYQLHLHGIGEVKSLKVLHEVFR